MIVVLEVIGDLEGEADATVIPFDSTFGADFSAFMDHPGLPNTVYACHDYSRSVWPFRTSPGRREMICLFVVVVVGTKLWVP